MKLGLYFSMAPTGSAFRTAWTLNSSSWLSTATTKRLKVFPSELAESPQRLHVWKHLIRVSHCLREKKKIWKIKNLNKIPGKSDLVIGSSSWSYACFSFLLHFYSTSVSQQQQKMSRLSQLDLGISLSIDKSIEQSQNDTSAALLRLESSFSGNVFPFRNMLSQLHLRNKSVDFIL